MFKGSESTNFKTDTPQEKVYEAIQDELETLGSVVISDNGIIRISGTKFNGFSHEVIINGRIRTKENRYNIELDWEAKPNWFLVILTALCLVGIGIALLIFPYMASKDLQKKISTSLDNIKFEFK